MFMGLTMNRSTTDRFAACSPELVERVARKVAERDGWDKWDTAVNFNDTLNGNDPDDERDYYRELVLFVLQEASK